MFLGVQIQPEGRFLMSGRLNGVQARLAQM